MEEKDGDKGSQPTGPVTPGPTPKGKTYARALRVNVFAIGLAALWIPLNTLVLPDRVNDIAPAFLRGSSLGLITVVGIGLATVLQPMAGRISDRGPLSDRRRPLIVLPALAMLPALALFGLAPGFLALFAAYVLMQALSNVAQAALQGVLPDLFDEKQRGVASSVKIGLDVAGIAIGLAAVGLLLHYGVGFRGALLFMAALLAFTAALSWLWVPKIEGNKPDAQSWRELLTLKTAIAPFRDLASSPKPFRRAVATRFLFLLGLYIVERFLIYYLEHQFHIDKPEEHGAPIIVGGFLLAAAGSFIFGPLSDKIGRRTVMAGSAIAGAIGVAGVAAAPSIPFVVVAGGLMAFATGAFQASNWAELSDSIPSGQGAQYFGLANVATAGSSAVAGLLGPVVDVSDALAPHLTYRIVFGIASLIVLSSLLVLRGSEDARSASKGEAKAPRELAARV